MTTRSTIFALLSMCIMFGWVTYVERQERQRLAKVKAAKAEAAVVEAKKKADEIAKEGKKPDAKGKTAPKEAAKADPKAPPAKEVDKGKKVEAAVKPAPQAPQPPLQTVVLGDNVDNGDYRIFAKLSTRGAVVTELDLPAYVDGALRSRFTLLNRGASYRLTLEGEDLGDKVWEYVAKESKAPTLAVFKTTAKEGAVEVVKRYSLEPKSYMVGLKVGFRNLSAKPIDDLSYELEGGQNLPIEGLWYTSYFRHAVTCIMPKGAAPYLDEQINAAIAQDANGRGQPLEANPIRFAGTSVQYFASVVIQEPDPRVQRLIKSVLPVLRPTFEDLNAPNAAKKPKEPSHANVGVVIKSQPVRLEPAATVEHEYSLFNGPKRKNLFEAAEYAAHDLDKLIVYQGFFGFRFDSVSNFMVWFLDKLYSVVGDYGVAIILLTVCVRLCLFPISFRQALSMQKMQQKMAVMQPKLEEIKKTYANDRDRLNREMMELYRKHDMNPIAQMAGCLPVFLQMPIFVGLYQALQGSFNLRLAPFHFTWMNDLASPDQLFAFPGPLPWLGPYFNLLPLISLAQILLQMQFMTPPATTPEMQEQQKQTQMMMRIMMIFMFFTFYKVPAGLCVYIIVSGSWAMLERQFLPKAPKPVAAAASTAASTNGSVVSEAKWKVPIKDKKKRGK